MKTKLLVSFSGGETSAYMAWWLWTHKQSEYEMIFVFANTGQETEETLQFIRNFENHFKIKIVWIEAIVHHGERKGNSAKVVDFLTASRDGQPFEQIIRKHGIPNQNFPHCTRELKQVPIKSYAKTIGWKNYYTAIGIREDEIDRINAKSRELKFIYPLISKSMQPMTKSKINFWWSQQSFRLQLKGYQGNCKACWKKSDKKLFQLAIENEVENFGFASKMEDRYGKFTPDGRLFLMSKREELPAYPITFFRGKRSAIDIINQAKDFNGEVKDDAQEFDLIGGDSCEVFSSCSEN